MSMRYANAKYPNAHLDPDLLLNPSRVGVKLLIPAPGRYFRYSDNHVLYRNNPENPIETEARLESLEKAK